MAHQVKWDSFILSEFVKTAMLNDEEIFIMSTRIQGKPVSWQAMELNCSESRIHKIIAMLKQKYDNAAEHNSNLPQRKFSARETWMDSN